jgi:hypothetical protein
MPTTEPSLDRARFGFVEAIRSAFSFLSDRDFEMRSAGPTFVRYESPAAFVNVFHGRGSYELGVEVGRWVPRNGEQMEQKFPLSDVIELTGYAGEAGLRPLVATDPEAVKQFVTLLADWTRAYADRALSGDNQFFSELSRRAAARSDALQAQWHADRLREDADNAWRGKDYPAVDRAYTALAELPSISLTQSELGRLSYARKHMG